MEIRALPPGVIPIGREYVLTTYAPSPLHLSVALDGAGWHPAAWRTGRARADELLSPRYWVDVVTEAERGLLDFVTFEDGLSLQSARFGAPDHRTDQVRGRLDSVLIAARVAPVTRSIGLIPTVIVTHTEPFHASKAIATLDYVSTGRAGVRVRVSASPHEAAHFGRRDIPDVPPPGQRDDADPALRQFLSGLFDEAADYVEVMRRLWDSWQDDAEIRDAAHRAVHRPGQAALHRLRRGLLQRQRAIHHPAAPARAAARGRPRARGLSRTG